MEKRLLVVGDIHGRFKAFEKLLEYVKFNSNGSEDHLISTGDLIDRGPDSYKVVDWFIKQAKETNGRVGAVFGNHEHLFIDYMAGDIPGKDYLNKFIGGEATVKSYEIGCEDEDEFYTHIEYLQSLPLAIEIDDFIISHSGIDPAVGVNNQIVEVTTWDCNETYKTDTSKFNKTMIYGHVPTGYIYEHYGVEPTGEIYRGGNQIAVDCSNYPERKLAILDVFNDIEYYYDFKTRTCYYYNNYGNIF